MDATQPYAERLAAARQRIEDVYHHRHNGVLPFVIGDVNYWLSGETPALIPGDYFTRPGSMLEYQTGKIRRHLARFADDYVPLLFPWHGRACWPPASAQIVFPEKMDPAVRGAVLSRPEDVGKLGEPDPHKDGLMPRVLETIRYFRAHSDLPISFTDPQGPFTTALTLAGPERLFLWLYEYPQAVHELMDRSTEAFIRWIKAQKEEIGDRSGGGCYPHGIVLPERFGGMWLCDDDCGAISAEHYRQFVVPYLSRIFRAFGGGTMHFCGTAEQQLENFLRIEGLVGINNFCMGNFRQIFRMQELYRDRLVLKVCDFTPLKIRPYYTELLAGLKRHGTILGTFIAPEMALNGGKYEAVSRRGEEVAEEAYACFHELGLGCVTK